VNKYELLSNTKIHKPIIEQEEFKTNFHSTEEIARVKDFFPINYEDKNRFLDE